MRALIWMIGGTILLAATSSAAGAAWATSPALDKCTDKADANTGAMRDCDFDEEDVQDHELNTLYKQAMAHRDPAGQKQLRAQQRIWLKRLKTCEQFMEEDGGQSVLMSYDSCRVDHYDRRIKQLKDLVNGGK